MRGILLGGMLLLMTGCAAGLQNGTGGVSLSVEPETTEAGATITMILRNDSPAAVGYNLCSSTLEQRLDGAWQPVMTDRVCTLELRTLAAGQVTTYPMELPADLGGGEYRFITAVEFMEMGTRGGVQSGTFRISG